MPCMRYDRLSQQQLSFLLSRATLQCVCLVVAIVPNVTTKKESVEGDIAASEVEPTSQATNAKLTNTALSAHLESKLYVS